ncbi:histidine kinase dimerization/phospho-acceptor domain-containing protein [Nocardioides aequoreus]|uniref:histidine kinase dimerization/phospho-acceptor domain-containing protein n=1 Tax=Nocardioides aequoreus TaxID=397278 RepID=UPI0004C2C19F|nr:histidine kinase dimerization/phospho-acceptor domain-containing protein [Nocardioides aequoreus]
MTSSGPRLGLVSSQPAAPTDARVAAVLDVMSGTPLPEVAVRSGVEQVLLRRWVRAFTDAGTAALTNRPEADVARQRDRFLAGFAHELRTPLAVARGWASMLADGDLPPSMLESTAEKLESALGDVAARVADVQYLAAASLGRLEPTPRATSLREIATLAGVAVHATADLDHALVTDPELAARAVHDLWDAAQLPPAPASCHLAATHHGAWLELRIARTADPIEPHVLQALFEPFDANDDGTGVSIGLYLARALTVALGGTLGLEQDDRHGHFWLRLPLSPTTNP